MIPSTFAYSHKSNDDFVFRAGAAKLAINPANRNVCFFRGTQFVWYQPKPKQGMLEMLVQFSTLEPGFEQLRDPFALVLLEGTPRELAVRMLE